METLIISADSEPKSIAENLVKIIREHSEAEMVTVGAEALSQAINAVIIAEYYLRSSHIIPVIIPSRVGVTIEDADEKLGIKLSVLALC